MAGSEHFQVGSGAGRDSGASFEELVAEYVDRLSEGELLDPDAIREAHPDIAEKLITHLEAFVEIGPAGTEAARIGTLGDYTLRREIGRGGMGVVYDAWQNSMDRQVALKVLPAGIAADRHACARFMREAQTAGHLHHPNVVTVHGMGVEQNTPYYAMEYVEGKTLAQVLAKIKDAQPEADTPFGRKDDVRYFHSLGVAFADVADGLQHAHSRGVIHRDIKPSNLILDEEGNLRVLDFGLAHLEGQESLTATGDVVGTPLYMSPEQARGKKTPVDHRTDVYSLGATMYEMLTGGPPFRGKDHSDTLSQIIEREPVEPRKVDSRVPRDLETIVLKCLRKDPADRYGTAEALAQDLRRFVRGDPIEARAQGEWEKLARRLFRYRRQIGVGIVFFAVVAVLGLLLVKARRDNWLLKEAEYEPKILQAVSLYQHAMLTERVGTFLPTPERSTPLTRFDVDQRELSGRNLEAVREAAQKLTQQIESLPHRADAYLHRARCWLVLGREDEALLDLTEARSRDECLVPAYLLEASIQEGRGEEKKARLLRGEAEIKNREWFAAFVGAQRAMEEKRWSDAVKANEDLLELQKLEKGGELYVGSLVETQLRLGLAHHLVGNYIAAVENFVVAQERWPQSLEPVLLLGEARYLAGEREYAEASFQKYYQKTSIADTTFRDSVALGIAAVYNYLEDFEKGREWAERVEDEARRAGALMVFLIKRHPEDAIALGEKALKDNPNDARLLSHLAFAYSRSDEPWEKSQELYEQAIEEDPDYVAPYFLLGIESMARGRFEEAIERFEKSNLAGDLPTAQKWLGLIWHLKGNNDRALSELRKGQNAYEKMAYVKPMYVESLTVLGQLLEHLRKPKEALTHYARALEIEPERAWQAQFFAGKAERHVARILRRENTAELGAPLDRLVAVLRAVVSKGRLVKTGEMPPRKLTTLALALAHHPTHKRIPEALAYAHEAVEMTESEDPECLSVLAEVQALSGDLAGAVRTLERAVSLSAADPCLALLLQDYRRELLPELVSYASVDAMLDFGETDVLISRNAEWRFFVGREDPSDDLEWTQIHSDASNWKIGKGGFGYGLDHPYRTWIQDMAGTSSALYLRRLFEVAKPDAIKELLLLVWASDGVVVYLNGQEVWRRGAGSEGSRDPYRVRVGHLIPDSSWGQEAIPVEIGPSTLKTGTNCLAIQGSNRQDKQHFFFLNAVLASRSGRDRQLVKSLLEVRGEPRYQQYLEARILQEEEKYREAAEKFRALVEWDPDSPEPKKRYAECLRQLGVDHGADHQLHEFKASADSEQEI